MEFGTPAVFELLKAGMASGDPEFYNDLDRTVDRSIGHMVRSSIPYPDADDVLQLIKISVWQQMSIFLNSSESNLPAQRNAWLKIVAKNKIIDFYRKNNLKQEFSLEDTQTDPPSPVPPPDAASLREAERLVHCQLCYRAISYLCSLDMTPDRLLACLYNGLILPLIGTGSAKKKGSPAALVQHFSGRPLSQLRASLWRALCDLLDSPPPHDLLAPLDRKLRDGWADKPFQLTAREITLVTNRAKDTKKKRREDIVGGTLDE